MRTNRIPIAIMQRSCSDSLLTASQSDGVFGSDRVKYGSAGAGSASHVSCILLNAALGINIVHIPYRGLGPAMQDLIACRIDYMSDSPSTSRPQIETNKLKAIAPSSSKRTSV